MQNLHFETHVPSLPLVYSVVSFNTWWLFSCFAAHCLDSSFWLLLDKVKSPAWIKDYLLSLSSAPSPSCPKRARRAFFAHANLDMAPVIILKGLRDAVMSLSMFPRSTALPLLEANRYVNECCELDIGSDKGNEDFLVIWTPFETEAFCSLQSIEL